jgi:hypothetical protein
VDYEWDEEKLAANRSKHGIDFGAVENMNWSKAIIVDRSRHADGETRFAGIGLLKDRLHTVVFTWREGRMRIISLRRSNKGEEKIYAKETRNN